MVKYLYDGTDTLEDQSQVKHQIIGEYLRQYYLTYFTDHRIQKLRLAIVDGFSGGGVFTNGIGTPLLSMKITNETELEISIKRGKPVKIETKFYFIDTDQQATQALTNNIEDHSFQNENFTIFNAAFGATLPEIIADIKVNFSRSERCIFILDPYDYTSVHLNHIKAISCLKNSEIIWLVTNDHIAHYVSEKTDIFESSFTKIGATPADIIAIKAELLSAQKTGGWPLCRHIICKFLVEQSGFRLGCDFPIRQISSNKDYTILHLSKHERAREVMVLGHWQHGNNTQIVSHNGVKYVQPSHIYKNNDMFSFAEHDRKEMIKNAAEGLLKGLPKSDEIRVEEWKNLHAAQFSAMTSNDFTMAMELVRSDVDFLTKDNRETKSINSAVAIRKKWQFSF